MGTIKENYDLMFTSYPDLVNVVQLKEMLGIGITLAYRLVKNKTIPALKVGREYKIPKRNVFNKSKLSHCHLFDNGSYFITQIN